MAIIDLESRQPVFSNHFAESDNRMDGGEDYVSLVESISKPSLRKEPVGDTGSFLPPPRLQSSLKPSSDDHLSPTGSPLSSIQPIQPINHRPDEGFSSLLNEITLPALKAEDETKPDGKWEPKGLKPRHREMMRRILEGATYVEIAEEMGLHVQTVMLVCSSAIFKEELKSLDEDLNLNIIRRAEELSNEALDKLKVLMRRAKSEALQASCARDVLGIAGYSKIEKKQVAVISGEDVIRELNRRRRELTGHSSIDARTKLVESIASEV